MTRSFTPAITSRPRRTASIIVYGAKPAARAFSLRRTETQYFEFLLPPPDKSVHPEFQQHQYYAYYLMLASLTKLSWLVAWHIRDETLLESAGRNRQLSASGSFRRGVARSPMVLPAPLT